IASDLASGRNYPASRCRESDDRCRRMLGMTATLSVASDSADVELDGFRLGYVAADGTQAPAVAGGCLGGAVRGDGSGPPVQGSERSAASAGPVVVIDDGWSRRVRVVAGTRPVDVVGL